jgi:hypothetical protein
MTELVWPTPLFSPALLLTTDHAANHVSSLTKILINLVAVRQTSIRKMAADHAASEEGGFRFLTYCGNQVFR